MEKEEFNIDHAFKQLVETALANENQPFQFIGSLAEWSAAKTCVRATKKVVKLFKSLEENSAMSYVELIKNGKQSTEVLLANIQFKQCVKFYEKELATLKDMLKEYNAYVFGGNVIKTLLGIYRSEQDMVDYRTLPWKLF